MDKLIIEARVNEYADRKHNPHVPWSPEEIAETAAQCRDAGASVVHFHARDSGGGADHGADTNGAIIRRIRASTDLLVHPTLGAFTHDGDAGARIAPLLALAEDPATRPDLAPLDMGSTNVDAYDPRQHRFISTEGVYLNSTATLLHFAGQLRRVGVKPYAVCWNLSFTRQLLAFLDMGAIDEPLYLCFVLTGDTLPAGHPPTRAGLEAHLACLPPDRDIHWTLCCHGGDLLALAPHVIAAGGHLSIGLGDWPYTEYNTPTNAGLVGRVADMARRLGRELATPQEASALLGIA